MRYNTSVTLISSLSSPSTDGECDVTEEGIYPKTHVTTSEIYELILAENYKVLDPALPLTIEQIKERGGHRCWHKHSTFLDHLLGVHNILRLWGQSPIVGRVGLLHSAYSNSYVNLALFDPNKDEERNGMRTMIGHDAEEIVHLFCIIDRQSVVVDRILGNGYIPNEELQVPHLRNKNETVHLSSEIMRLLVIFTMADVADQYFGWQDRLFGGLEGENSMLIPGDDDQRKHESTALWPGTSKPGLWMSYVSELGAVLYKHDVAAASDNDNVDDDVDERRIIMPIPPVFDNCTKILSRENEAKARDLYWSVVMEVVPSDRVIETLQQASKINPWFYESYVMLAQKYLHQNENGKAKEAAEKALSLQMMWGTAYDKRMSFPAWVAWTRVLYQRANEGAGWPENSWEVNNFGMVAPDKEAE